MLLKFWGKWVQIAHDRLCRPKVWERANHGTSLKQHTSCQDWAGDQSLHLVQYTAPFRPTRRMKYRTLILRPVPATRTALIPTPTANSVPLTPPHNLPIRLRVPRPSEFAFGCLSQFRFAFPPLQETVVASGLRLSRRGLWHQRAHLPDRK